MQKPIVWTIAGSDSSSGAGIQADLLTFNSFNVRAATVITAITAQSAHGIRSIHSIPGQYLRDQINLLSETYFPDAIKIGMLGSLEAINTLFEFMPRYRGQLILDPVLQSSSGANLFNIDRATYLQYLCKLFPFTHVITPNIPEAESILNVSIKTHNEMEQAAHQFIQLGAKNVVLKGGHLNNSKWSQDVWTNGKEICWLISPMHPQQNYRGTGCVFSSAFTACLALGHDIKDSLVKAKMYINRGIRNAATYENAAFLQHGSISSEGADLPYLSSSHMVDKPIVFAPCDRESLRLYPIVDSYHLVQQLLSAGVKTIQLRIKNLHGDELENEILQSIRLAKNLCANIFINDYWQLAIKYHAYGVHLGQEDLDTADIKKIHTAGLKLGISTHCFSEVARAHAVHPSYIACGPIYATKSKEMPFMPQGIANLKYWRKLLKRYPLVAIGGINENNIKDVLATGVDGVAMISAITKAAQPSIKAQEFLSLVREYA